VQLIFYSVGTFPDIRSFLFLGEGYNQVRVGQLCTPVGTLHLSVSYRTKLTISPQSTCRD